MSFTPIVRFFIFSFQIVLSPNVSHSRTEFPSNIIHTKSATLFSRRPSGSRSSSFFVIPNVRIRIPYRKQQQLWKWLCQTQWRYRSLNPTNPVTQCRFRKTPWSWNSPPIFLCFDPTKSIVRWYWHFLLKSLDISVIYSITFSLDGFNLSIGSDKALRIYKIGKEDFLFQQNLDERDDQRTNHIQSIVWMNNNQKCVVTCDWSWSWGNISKCNFE
jgi:hypothetical protein